MTLHDTTQIHRFSQPDPQRPLEFTYADQQVLEPADSVSPLKAPNTALAVTDLLPCHAKPQVNPPE